MKYIITALFLISTILTNAQEDVKILHYQKKAELTNFLIVSSKYDSSIFNVLLSDSSYNSGELLIKKGTINNIKFKFLKVSFEKEIYTKIEFRVKNKKSIQELLNKLNIAIDNFRFNDDCFSINNKKNSIQIIQIKNSLTLLLGLPKC